MSVSELGEVECMRSSVRTKGYMSGRKGKDWWSACEYGPPQECADMLMSTIRVYTRKCKQICARLVICWIFLRVSALARVCLYLSELLPLSNAMELGGAILRWQWWRFGESKA